MEFAPCTLRQAGEAIEQVATVVIASHTRPDGDALGSQIALAESLRETGKTVVSIHEDGVPERYAFLPGSDRILRPGRVREKPGPHLFVALDTGDPERLGGEVWKFVSSRRATLVIDHHASNRGYGDLNWVEPSRPATGELVFELITEMGWPLTPAVRDSLWAAIATDTGSFQYPSTSPGTLRIAARLLEEGLDLGRMSERLFQDLPFRRLEFLRELLGTVRRSPDGRIASWRLTREALKRHAIQPADCEGLIDHLRSIAGVVVAVSFEEETDATVRISARSKDAELADVARICQAFGGGGHRLAAGARVQGTLDSVSERFLSALTHALEHGTA
jgi:phosphoesterase RecJ-like protein